MKNTVIVYVHGKGGSAEEALQYIPLSRGCELFGIDYKKSTPWEAGKEIRESILSLKQRFDSIILIANSIGAYFSMNAEIEFLIEKAYFISPIVDMEKLIRGMMTLARVSEKELESQKTVRTDFGEDLSWEYYSFAKAHPVKWGVPTEVLYGSEDYLTDYNTIKEFCSYNGARLTVMKGGEHWFHTKEQTKYLINWIKKGMEK